MRRLFILLLLTLLPGVAVPAALPKTQPAPVPKPEPSLRIFPSQYYLIKTDLEAGLAQELARRMDAMHQEYAWRLEIPAPISPQRPSQVYLFSHRDDYLRFVGPGFRSTGGAFMPGGWMAEQPNTLAAFLEGQGRDGMRRTLQHEALHQFVSLTMGDRLPIWLNEGMAQYFEEGLWTEAGFLLGQVPPRRLRQLDADITAKRLIPFDQLLAMTPAQWQATLNSRGETRGATQYNQAWAMVHFLVNATDATGQPLRNRLIKMLQLVRNGMEGKRAFETCFQTNYEGFQRSFIAFARQMKATPEATYMERQEVLADMLLAASEHGWAADDMAALRETVAKRHVHIDYSRGQIHWSTEPDTSVYFRDLQGGLFDASELYLSSRRSAPLPDIICRYSPTMQLRTRFYREGGQTQHDTLLEVAPGNPSLLASPRK